jgi:UDP-N-acetylglucosamine--N-acetylmuramyl-(pentapeptide) pyrophosphoryl-undecaprenol N-acetylglucosamine transferase
MKSSEGLPKEKRILFTGGGTAGHVIPNLALIDAFKLDGWTIHYIGTKDGIERSLIEQEADIFYSAISSGKLRRYFSWQNFIDPFKIASGVVESFIKTKQIKPVVIFSKGGFVTVPVVIAGWLNGIPIVIHESDITPGLANKLSIPFAKKVCTTFPETVKYIKANKGVCTGAIVRPELFNGTRTKGSALCGFDDAVKKPILLIMGGSLGAVAINDCIRSSLSILTETFDIIHICGKGNIDQSIKCEGYVQFDYVSDDLPDIMASADVVVSRAGANAIFELLSLKKPTVLIPYPKSVSRGDQVLNAASFKAQGYCDVLDQDTMSPSVLTATILGVYKNREQYITAMKSGEAANGIDNVLSVIMGVVNG